MEGNGSRVITAAMFVLPNLKNSVNMDIMSVDPQILVKLGVSIRAVSGRHHIRLPKPSSSPQNSVKRHRDKVTRGKWAVLVDVHRTFESVFQLLSSHQSPKSRARGS